ncbi:MAG: L,D-transpeptidase family protein [Ruminococcus sp.]|uniref:L,D-transpeptidase family protein n=1 Tax=Ruminococcus sp. TaxID=41978 RepID=UPI002873548C|nr:L,D-transpeptidase family protein [Ruminococcus sp.]MBQ3284763.1 L,D-transpeptidase family protein [Ruminococcus sp.]
MKKRTLKTRIIAGILSLITVFTVGAAAVTSASAASTAPADDVSTSTLLGESPDWVTKLPAAQDTDQLFVVAAYDKTTAWVSMHEKDSNGNWQMIMTTPGFIGKNGLGKTMEGDGKTPVGTFGFNAAFGIADDPGCAIPYTKVDNSYYWSGDVRDGMQYNKMINIKDYPDLDKDNSEHIIDYTRHYQYCLNISYNEECTPGAGSAIFLHCLGPNKPFTGGCIAIPENQMKAVMQNVKPDCKVVIDSLDNLGGEF